MTVILGTAGVVAASTWAAVDDLRRGFENPPMESAGRSSLQGTTFLLGLTIGRPKTN